MEKRLYVQVLLPLKLEWTPWYYTEKPLRVGQRVGVVFARKQMVGAVLSVDGTPDIDVSRVQKISCTDTGLADISSSELELWHFVSQYYMCTLGEVFKAAYPGSKINSEKIAVQQSRRREAGRARMEAALAKRAAGLEARLAAKQASILARTGPVSGSEGQCKTSGRCKPEVTARLQAEKDALELQLSQAKAALEAFRAGAASSDTTSGAHPEPGTSRAKVEPGTPLLVRGAERSRFYIEKVKQCLEDGFDALVLEPEAELGQNLEEPFAEAFGESLKLFGGGLSARGKRVLAQQLRDEHEPMVIIGQRSALFLPFSQLGLVVVDEEQDASYKQSEPTPRYNGRDLAVVLAKIHGAQLILGSACPSLESLLNALSGKYLLFDLPQSAAPARVDIIDINAERRKNGMVGDFSRKAIDTLRKCPQDALVTVVRCFTSEEDTVAQLRELFPDRDPQILTAYAARRSAAISDLTLVMQADALFDRADFRADEKALQLLTLLKSRTRRLIVQTGSSAHPVFAALADSSSHPDPGTSSPSQFGAAAQQATAQSQSCGAEQRILSAAQQALLAERKQFGLPPYTRIIDLYSRKDGTLVQRLILPRDSNLAVTKAQLFATRQDLWFDVDPQ